MINQFTIQHDYDKTNGAVAGKTDSESYGSKIRNIRKINSHHDIKNT